MDKTLLLRQDFEQLYQALKDEGYQVVGPTEKQGAIQFEHINNFEQLPWGRQEQVEPGSYQLKQAQENRCFQWNTGPQSFKPYLFSPTQMLWTGDETDDGLVFKQVEPTATPLAFIGVRSCDIAALYLQDKHFMHSQYPDVWYTQQREQMFIVAVNCSQSAATCFCASTGDGPEASFGFDLLLDEIDYGYLLLAKSEKGNRVLSRLTTQEPAEEHLHQAQAQLQTAAKQERSMPDAQTLKKLTEHLDDEQWLRIADRCLACGNCTSVCPTCFCSKQESEQELGSGQFQQVRYWDSCFSEQHGHIAGKNIRAEISQRYRQWVHHKLSAWQDQYLRSGCVGCGRCVIWCPAAIDLVAEVNQMLEADNDQ